MFGEVVASSHQSCYKTNMVLEHKDYREFLREILATRCQNNPRYSLRAFARDIGVSPSQLSEVLNSRYGFSKAASLDIAARLSLSAKEQGYFCALVESENTRSKAGREAAKEKVEKYQNDYNQIALDAFKVIADWYHMAILELIQMQSFQNDQKWIANYLGISTHEISVAIERLKRLELIQEEDGKLKLKYALNSIANGVSSDSIKKFHRQILEKAMAAIQMQSVQERDLSSIILAFNSEDMGEAKAMIKKFRREFDSKFSKKKNKNSLYCLNTQFFRLNENI